MPSQVDQKTYRSALQNLLCCRPVAYYASLARAVGGVCPALMLSQLLYWHGVKSGEEFFKSVQEMAAETGLTVDEQNTARKKLVDCGAVIAKRSGWPATWHYQVDLDRISELLSDYQNPPQIPTLQDSANSRLLQQQTLATQESADSRVLQKQTPVKSTNRFRQNRNLSEGRNNELNTESTSENTREEEEGPSDQNFQVLDESLISDLLDFGVFKSKLLEIDQAGWAPDQLRQLMRKCAKDDRHGTPAALLLKRIHEWRPPTKRIDYPQYNNPPEMDPPDPVVVEFEKVLSWLLSANLRGAVDYELYEVANDPSQVDVVVSCIQEVWDRYFVPNIDTILQRIQPVGVNSLSLSA